MKKISILLSLLLLSGCGGLDTGSAYYDLYFLSRTSAAGEGLVPIEWIPPDQTEVTPEHLVTALLTPPLMDYHGDPFPTGTTMVSLRLSGKIATLRLSWQYSQLQGISRTLADYAIVLTLCQLDEVDGVILVVDGEETPRLVRRAEDLLEVPKPEDFESSVNHREK